MYDFDPSEFYKALLEKITEADTKKVAAIMTEFIGEDHHISLKDLTARVFGEFNTNTERKVRLILEDLVTNYRFPIGAYSGKSGRWLCKNKEERDRVISDLESRRDATSERIKSLQKAVIPASIPQIEKNHRQNSLWQ
ncbi:MAG: hypothetical protein CVU46_17205 [Chloroflexi bacterium HGW-Chloroflexi-8]|jgi:hypothetical protein|nr:MAG: hypothetical protein CVU46_17205 [Chloroflexi bacterium HGW-Chloroflexi-8]